MARDTTNHGDDTALEAFEKSQKRAADETPPWEPNDDDEEALLLAAAEGGEIRTLKDSNAARQRDRDRSLADRSDPLGQIRSVKVLLPRLPN